MSRTDPYINALMEANRRAGLADPKDANRIHRETLEECLADIEKANPEVPEEE